MHGHCHGICHLCVGFRQYSRLVFIVDFNSLFFSSTTLVGVFGNMFVYIEKET